MAGVSNDRVRRLQRLNLVLFLALVAMFGWLIVSRVDLFYARNEATDYKTLWKGELDKRRLNNSSYRIEAIERRTAAVAEVVRHQSPEVRHDFKKRLADIRQHFSGIVRGPQAPSCPKPRVVAPAPAPVATAGPDVAAVAPEPEVLTVEKWRKDRASAERLHKLQAWVREHLAAYHGVPM